MKPTHIFFFLIPTLVFGQVRYPVREIDSLFKEGNYALALKLNNEYLNHTEGKSECLSIPLALYKTGEILDLMKSRTEAYRFFHLSLSRAKQCQDDSVEWLSTRYLGGFFFYPPNKDSVLYYLNKAYQMIKDKNMPRQISSVTGMLGETWSKIFMNEAEGLRWYKISIAHAIQSKDYHPLGYAYFRYGAYLVYHGNCLEGLPMVEKALELFSQNNDREGEVWLMKGLSQYYKDCNQVELGHRMALKTIQKQDSLFSNEIAKQTAQYQAMYESDKKQRENLQLAKDNQLKKLQIETQTKQRENLILIFALVTVMAIALLFVLYRQQSLKKKNDLEKQLQAERERIARELHDNIGAQLSQLSSSLDWAGDKANPVSDSERQVIITSGLQTTKDVISDLRESIWALKKTQIPVTEFADKLKTNLKGFTHSGKNIPVIFYEELNGNVLGSEEALDLLRICQEGVHNSFHHSGGTQICLTIRTVGKGYEIKIEDNGKGFEITANDSDHFGIENMNHRAKQIGAKFTLQSDIGKGTTITISK